MEAWGSQQGLLASPLMPGLLQRGWLCIVLVPAELPYLNTIFDQCSAFLAHPGLWVLNIQATPADAIALSSSTGMHFLLQSSEQKLYLPRLALPKPCPFCFLLRCLSHTHWGNKPPLNSLFLPSLLNISTFSQKTLFFTDVWCHSTFQWSPLPLSLVPLIAVRPHVIGTFHPQKTVFLKSPLRVLSSSQARWPKTLWGFMVPLHFLWCLCCSLSGLHLLKTH